MGEEVYGLTLDPKDKGTYSAGPTPDVRQLLAETPEPEQPAEIHLLSEGEPVVIYKWRGYSWQKVGDPFEFGPGARLVLDEMNLEPRKGGVLLVSCRVEQFSVEAKVKPADYEQARGYANFVPRDLWVHVPVFDPERLVNESGNVEILGAVYRYIARELDMAVFDTANRRLDLRTQAADERAAQKKKEGGGVKIGQAPKKDVGEAL